MTSKKEPTARVRRRLKHEDALDYGFVPHEGDWAYITDDGFVTHKVIIHFGHGDLVQIGWRRISSVLGVQDKAGMLFSGYIETRDEFKVLLRQLRISK
jgi:hypothetical protein